jgi:S-disulfanyl-L-cysteine oxidoreductase SoxD
MFSSLEESRSMHGERKPDFVLYTLILINVYGICRIKLKSKYALSHTSITKSLLGVLLMAAVTSTLAQQHFPGIGRAATAEEIKAWDIDVRPDFKGLPPGSGTVQKGQEVWETKCASCHGIFGESNEVFTPLIGGTTKKDIERGRVANLQRQDYPQRTSMMKVSSVSTLWDYINRAMPWTQPKSLTVEEVYATTAFMLHLSDVLPADGVLSDKNTAHAMWPGTELGGKAQPDVQGSACVRDCKVEPTVASFIPDHARNAHGNLAEQNRTVGPQRGVNTSVAAVVAAAAADKPDAAAPSAKLQQAASSLLTKYACVACHAQEQKMVGPSFKDIAKRYEGKGDAAAYLADKIKSGGQGEWGNIPMPAQALSADEATGIAQWLAAGAK